MEIILGQVFALLTAACWGQNSIAYAFAGKRVGSRAVTHVRLWIALPIILCVHFIFTGLFLPTGLNTQVYIFLGLSGFVGFFLADIFLFTAFVDLGPRETMVIMTLSPIFSASISWIAFSEVLTPIQITGGLTTIAGVMWVVFEKNPEGGKRTPHQLRGVLFAFLGAITQALGMVLAKGGMTEGVHPVSANSIRVIAGLGGLTLYSLVTGGIISDFKRMKDTKALLYITSGAVIGPVLGMILSMYALTLAPVGIVTTLMQTTPILLLPIDRYVFHKHITVRAVVGTVLAIAGAGMLFVFQ